MNSETITAIDTLIQAAAERYGPFASTHEAMGVALEEWHEFMDAVRANDMASIRHECLDLAAVLIRLHDDAGDPRLTQRSKK